MSSISLTGASPSLQQLLSGTNSSDPLLAGQSGGSVTVKKFLCLMLNSIMD